MDGQTDMTKQTAAFRIFRTRLQTTGYSDIPVYKQTASRRRIPKDNIFPTNASTTLSFTYDPRSKTTVATEFNIALQKLWPIFWYGIVGIVTAWSWFEASWRKVILCPSRKFMSPSECHKNWGKLVSLKASLTFSQQGRKYHFWRDGSVSNWHFVRNLL